MAHRCVRRINGGYLESKFGFPMPALGRISDNFGVHAGTAQTLQRGARMARRWVTRLYFGPTKPQGVNEKNWIQTSRGKAFMVALRLYGSETAFFDQTWKPDDVVKVK